MEFLPPQAISLRTNPQFNEKWLQQKLTEDPALLGLGELVVKDVERRQLGAGRLDILLSDPESLTWYEVEIQLGSTDESHVIRTIEYWDLERRRYPQYDHFGDELPAQCRSIQQLTGWFAVSLHTRSLVPGWPESYDRQANSSAGS